VNPLTCRTPLPRVAAEFHPTVDRSSRRLRQLVFVRGLRLEESVGGLQSVETRATLSLGRVRAERIDSIVAPAIDFRRAPREKPGGG